MAGSFISIGQFGEFSKRVDERLDAVNQRFDPCGCAVISGLTLLRAAPGTEISTSVSGTN